MQIAGPACLRNSCIFLFFVKIKEKQLVLVFFFLVSKHFWDPALHLLRKMFTIFIETMLQVILKVIYLLCTKTNPFSEEFLRYRFKSAWTKSLFYGVVNSRPKASTNSVPIGRRQLWWWWHCQRPVLGQLYGVGSAPYIAVGACQSVTGVEPTVVAQQREAPQRVTALQYLLLAARADMRYLTPQIPPSSTTGQNQSKFPNPESYNLHS